MIQTHNAAIILRPFICADAKDQAHRTGHLHKEAAGRTRLLGTTATLRTAFRGVPALCSIVVTFIRENANAPQSQLTVRRQIRIFSGVLEPRNQAIIIVTVRQYILTAHITRLQAVLPREPLGCQKCAGTGYQINFAHRDLPRARNARQSDRPTPADVTGIVTGKVVSAKALGIHFEREVLSYRGFSPNFDRVFTRKVHRLSELLIHSPTRGRSFFRHQNPLQRPA